MLTLSRWCCDSNTSWYCYQTHIRFRRITTWMSRACLKVHIPDWPATCQDSEKATASLAVRHIAQSSAEWDVCKLNKHLTSRQLPLNWELLKGETIALWGCRRGDKAGLKKSMVSTKQEPQWLHDQPCLPSSEGQRTKSYLSNLIWGLLGLEVPFGTEGTGKEFITSPADPWKIRSRDKAD